MKCNVLCDITEKCSPLPVFKMKISIVRNVYVIPYPEVLIGYFEKCKGSDWVLRKM